MPEGLGLTHKEAAILMDAVFAPFMQSWQSDPRLRPLVQDQQARYHFLTDMAHALGALLHGREDPLPYFKSLCRQAQEVGLPLDAVEAYAHAFLDTFEKWVRQADLSAMGETVDAVMSRLEALRHGAIHCEADTASEEFLVADSEHMDTHIDRMHNITAQREAISAEAFLAEGYLDDDTIGRIVEDIETLSSELYFYGEFDADYAAFVTGHLEEFANALESTMEFDDLAWAVRSFIHVLQNLPADMTPEMRTQIKPLTDQFVEDLVGWVQHVLIDRDAQDIHYLDAALMAVVKQIALLLGIALETASDPPDGQRQDDEDGFLMF